MAMEYGQYMSLWKHDSGKGVVVGLDGYFAVQDNIKVVPLDAQVAKSICSEEQWDSAVEALFTSICPDCGATYINIFGGCSACDIKVTDDMLKDTIGEYNDYLAI